MCLTKSCNVILRVNLIVDGGRNFWGSKPFTEELFFCFDEKQKQNIVSEFFAKRSMSYSMDDNHYVCTVFEFRHGSKRWYWQIPFFWRTKRYGTQHGWLGFPKNHRSSFVAAAIGCYAHWCKQQVSQWRQINFFSSSGFLQFAHLSNFSSAQFLIGLNQQSRTSRVDAPNIVPFNQQSEWIDSYWTICYFPRS